MWVSKDCGVCVYQRLVGRVWVSKACRVRVCVSKACRVCGVKGL